MATGLSADVNRLNGTLVSGGNATAGEGWAATFKREMANRCFTSVLCSWCVSLVFFPCRFVDVVLRAPYRRVHSGHVAPCTTQPDRQYQQHWQRTSSCCRITARSNVFHTQMYEKFSNLNVNSSGYGGEYTVQAGFSWTNGVVLWVATNYGLLLVALQCLPLVASVTGSSSGAAGLRLSLPSMGPWLLLRSCRSLGLSCCEGGHDEDW